MHDIDSLPYKVMTNVGGSETVVYIDLEGNRREDVYFQLDTMPRPVGQIIDVIVRGAKLPRYYPVNEQYRGVVSFIVEKNGAITNLRVVEGFERSKSKELFPDVNVGELPEMQPGIKNGIPVPVEIRTEFILTSYGTIKRFEKKKR